MKHPIVIAAGLALAATLLSVPAQAQNARSFVSGHGLDTNACTLAAPCRTFAVAFSHTNAGGEIDVLDTAGYGPLTIDKAISIVNDGGVASVLVPSGGSGITVNAGANDSVSLRGLTIEGAGVGVTGIQFNTGASLAVENCVIRHVMNDGLNFYATTTSSLLVVNSLVADNGGYGIFVFPIGSASASAVLSRVQVNNNGNAGFLLEGDQTTGVAGATVSDSVASGNQDTGYFAFGPSTLTVFHSVSAKNVIGVSAAGLGATVRIAQSVVTRNVHGWNNYSGGVIASYGDNYIDDNVGSNTGSLTPVTRQ